MKSLEEKEWKEYSIESIFDIYSGKRLVASDSIPGDRPFIGAVDNNNGISRFCGDTNLSLDSNVLGINYNGSVGNGFYHPYECIFSDDVKRFHLKNHDDNAQILLFMKTAILQQGCKFGYAYKFNAERMNNTKILLPVNDAGDPDYEYMAEYIRQQQDSLLNKYRNYVSEKLQELGDLVEIPTLNEKEWKKFNAFGDNGILNIHTTSSSIDGIRLIDGDNKIVPYVTRSALNNGIGQFVDLENYSFGRDNAGSITIGLDTQTAFYQTFDFVTGQNIQIVTGDSLNEYTAQFYTTILKIQMDAKFNWGGNGATLGRLNKLEIMLPVDDNGNPDYGYMEQYVKNIMIKKYHQYLDYMKESDYPT